MLCLFLLYERGGEKNKMAELSVPKESESKISTINNLIDKLGNSLYENNEIIKSINDFLYCEDMIKEENKKDEKINQGWFDIIIKKLESIIMVSQEINMKLVKLNKDMNK